MAQARQVYGQIESKADLKEVSAEIREDVDHANARPALTELYKRAGYLVTLTHAPSWKKKFGPEAGAMRKLAEEEFAKTARKINRRAEAVGVEPDYDDTWGT